MKQDTVGIDQPLRTVHNDVVRWSILNAQWPIILITGLLGDHIRPPLSPLFHPRLYLNLDEKTLRIWVLELDPPLNFPLKAALTSKEDLFSPSKVLLKSVPKLHPPSKQKPLSHMTWWVLEELKFWRHRIPGQKQRKGMNMRTWWGLAEQIKLRIELRRRPPAQHRNLQTWWASCLQKLKLRCAWIEEPVLCHVLTSHAVCKMRNPKTNGIILAALILHLGDKKSWKINSEVCLAHVWLLL